VNLSPGHMVGVFCVSILALRFHLLTKEALVVPAAGAFLVAPAPRAVQLILVVAIPVAIVEAVDVTPLHSAIGQAHGELAAPSDLPGLAALDQLHDVADLVVIEAEHGAKKKPRPDGAGLFYFLSLFGK
jgi:hypothetical protein